MEDVKGIPSSEPFLSENKSVEHTQIEVSVDVVLEEPDKLNQQPATFAGHKLAGLRGAAVVWGFSFTHAQVRQLESVLRLLLLYALLLLG